MKKPLLWGMLATGKIAHAFAAGMAQTDSGKMVAVASRSKEKAQEFAGEFKIPKAYGSYDELLADPEVQAVYISTPHPFHAEWAVKAADAGKHILCEKPIALNQYDTMTIVEAARRNDVFLMEGFIYRCNPQMRKVVELIRQKAIGDVRMIQASFSFNAAYDPKSRLFNPALGGGGILDVGCYPVSFARLVAGAALGKEFADPIQVLGAAHIGAESKVDEWASALLKFDGGIVAQVSACVQLDQSKTAVIMGSEGRIEIPSPWFCNGKEAGPVKILLIRKGNTEEMVVDVPKGIYAIEAETVAENIHRRQAPAMSWDDTLGNMAALDAWRNAIGLEYPAESVEAHALPLNKKPLKARPRTVMSYGNLPGLSKRVSRLVMGCMGQKNIAHASALFDDFFERGGNAFDTAHIYGKGRSETLLGQWVKNRSVRDQVVIVSKGAHTPNCNPTALKKQLEETLERLQTDYLDIYFMHRDNPEIPVGEFIDVLNELQAKGKIRVFGVSNWTQERVDEAIQWAATHGKKGIGAISNNFSLAQMVNPVWEGSIASSRPDYKRWHERTRTPLFAWSSQARGFFVSGTVAPDKAEDKEVLRCWGSPENFERRERCIQLAGEKGVDPVSVALAYVLHQEFLTFALIGPVRISETVSSLEALEVRLSPSEVKWLNMEAETLQ